jgi:hypothetical protein
VAGTELDTGWDRYEDMAVMDVLKVPTEPGCAVGVLPSAFGREPPDKKEGHRERSSGREVPVDEDGDRCDNIAAA